MCIEVKNFVDHFNLEMLFRRLKVKDQDFTEIWRNLK